jgi:hypothetical protein
MDTLDNLNFSMRDDVVKFASSGLIHNRYLIYQYNLVSL